jgi:hypothetical protein
VSESQSRRTASEETGLGQRLRRWRKGLLSRTLPYYETRRAEKGDADVIEAAHRRLERRRRLPQDPDD